ncbi:MAG: transglycosylase domain-containing protein, partial [Synechocystis sp.]
MTEVALADVVTYAAPGTMTIKASTGKILKEIGNVSHDKVEIGKIPPLVEQAFIASEDRRFREHRGVDLQGILRASASNAKSGEVVQGGSTITQQLARLVYLTQDRTYARKIKELRLAQKIETTLPKDQILERYLNLIYLGSGAYGVADASYAYFSKAPKDLTLGEAATLAGVVPAPSLYSPLENLEAATKRRNQVLNKMAEVGFITEQEAQTAIAEPLKVKPSPLKRYNREAEFFTDYILKELKTKLPEDQLKAGGLTVSTTLNPDWQANAQSILKKSVEKYGQWQRFSEGAMVSVDPRTGAIKMMVGGKDYDKSQFNRVTQAKRQPGSTFKPILYATAIATGISPNKSYPDVPFEVNGYKPENYGDKYSGSNMSLRTALTGSVNVVAVRLLLDVGWNPVINLARKMGITSKIEPTYSLALGAWEMTPMEMTSAYGTFANKGVHVQPYAIQTVVNAKGETIYQAEHQQTKALDADSNAIMTSLMRSVVTSGTGRPAQLGDRQVAGKTGTSDKARDLWFIGYIPQLVTGVWIGNDNGQPTKGAST